MGRSINKDEKVFHEEVAADRDDASSPCRRPQTRGQKTKRHCARFWWAYLLALCLAIMIIVLCIVYVGMPHIAQQDVNRTTLNITDMQYLEPTSNSIVLTQRATLHNPSKFTPTLDAFNAGYYLVNNGTEGSNPLMQIPIPKVHATKPTTEVNIQDQPITFQSLEEVTKYTIAVLGNETVTMKLRGKTTLHLGSLPDTDVKYSEEFSFKGLDGLKGFDVTNLRINPLAVSGPNMQGTAYIPNPSVLTLALGNVSLVLLSGATTIGTALISDLTVRPNNNTFPIEGTLNQTLVLTHLDAGGNLNVNITGTSVVYKGQHLTYYEKALSLVRLPLSVNVGKLLAGAG